jgi:hypothetical protein
VANASQDGWANEDRLSLVSCANVASEVDDKK